MKKTKTAKKTKAVLDPRLAKAIDRLARPRPEPLDFRRRGLFPSIHDRVEKANTLVTLIAAAATNDGEDELLSDREVLDAIKAAANEALGELYWISELPPSIGNLPALSDDAYRDQGVDASERDDRDDYCRARMREMLDGAR